MIFIGIFPIARSIVIGIIPPTLRLGTIVFSINKIKTGED